MSYQKRIIREEYITKEDIEKAANKKVEKAYKVKYTNYNLTDKRK